MSKVNMSLHRILSEIKTYNDRISAAMNAVFVVANKRSNEKIGSKTIPEVIDTMKGSYASVVSLIENKKRLEAAKHASNAVTVVDVAGKSYTVAEAIVRKDFIVLEEKFLAVLKSQYTREKSKVEFENNQLPSKLESYLAATLGTQQRKVEDVAKYTDDFHKMHSYDLVDPLKLEDEIKKLEKDIIDFKTNVDYVLSTSNSTTFVDVELVD